MLPCPLGISQEKKKRGAETGECEDRKDKGIKRIRGTAVEIQIFCHVVGLPPLSQRTLYIQQYERILVRISQALLL